MLDAMRTTLTLDDDVLASARALAAQRGVPIGTIISDLARRGLAPTQAAATRNGIRLFPLRPDAVDLKLVSRLEFGSGAVAMRYEPRR